MNRSRNTMGAGRTALVVAAIVALAACRSVPTPQAATVIVTEPASVYSGESVDVTVAIARGDVLTDEVELELVSDVAGITAAGLTTADDVATMTVEVDASVPAGTYEIVVVATDAATSVESDAVPLEVLGVQPGALQGEIRSLLIPTPGDAGFPAPIADTAALGGTRSMVPGDDVPIEFDETRAVAGEILVRLASDAALRTSAAGDAHVMSVGGVRFVRPAGAVRSGTLQKWVAETPIGVDETIALAAALEARADVLSAMPNWILTAHQAVPPLYELQWHYPSIDLHEAWTIEDGSSAPVVVAVIDTGYQDHVDLSGIWLPGYDFVDGDEDATDGSEVFSHGTHVAGTIAMRLANEPFVAGVSRAAGIVPIRFLDDTGEGTIEDLLAGMVWASGMDVPGYDYPEGVTPPENANPAGVINMSLGGRIGPCPEEMAIVTQALVDGGVVLVASAGNSSQDTAMFSPGNCPGVLTVGATGPYDERAYYSNYGPDVDVFAPGGNFDFEYVSETGLLPFRLPTGVLSTTGAGADSDYIWAQGTSMAAPHVAGLAALLLAADTALTPAGVRDRLTSTATPLTLEACDRPSADECGFGLVNAHRALGGEGASAWEGAPSVTLSLFACDEAGCDDVDVDTDDPARELSGALTRAYWPFELDSLAPGTYALRATIEAPGTFAPLQTAVAVVEVVSGESERLVLAAEPTD